MKDFTKYLSKIDFNLPHFEQQSWTMLLKMYEALMLQVKQQHKQIIKLNGELNDLKK